MKSDAMKFIHSLPSKYRGVHFRSRLEARWAYYFDRIGLEWRYEPEGYNLSGEFYCPDFLCGNDWFFVEIKPNKEERDKGLTKAHALAKATGLDVFITHGPPSMDGCYGIFPQEPTELIPHHFCHLNGYFSEYPFKEKSWCMPFIGDGYEPDQDEIDLAFHAANVRFENGCLTP
jgi:hypothetical protein